MTPNGLYTAPANEGTYHVVATSHAEPSKAAVTRIVVTTRPLTTEPSGGTSGTGGLEATGATTGTNTGGTTGAGGTTSAGGAAKRTDAGGSDLPPVITCGNGVIDPGEDCDGSNLNGKTCGSLGFVGGSPVCASSCLLDTSGCSTGTTMVKVNVTPSRTSCAAPCAVFFDASGSTGLASSDYVGANFVWDFDSTNTDPNGAHEKTIGFLAAHVFENPGTYQVAVRVRDVSGAAASAKVPIVVNAPSGGSTFYVASNGSDSNAGDMAHPLATIEKALSHAGPNNAVLLRRGDTFSKDQSISISKVQGPFLLGAYTDPGASSTATPIIKISASGQGNIIGLFNSIDIRIADLHLISPNHVTNGISLTSGVTNILLLRVEVEGIGIETNGTNGLAVDVAEGVTGVFVVDCNFHDFVGYGVYGYATTQLAVVGTGIRNFHGGDHGIRVQAGKQTYIAETTCKVDVNGTDPPLTCYQIRGNNDKSVIVNSYADRSCAFSPQNTQVTESITNGLFEGNTVNDVLQAALKDGLDVHGQHIVVRNNLFLNVATAVTVEGFPNNPPGFVDQIVVDNNTLWYPSTGSAGVIRLVSHTSTTGTVTVQNNILSTEYPHGNQGQSTLVRSDGKGKEVEDHNLWWAPNDKSFPTPTGTGDVNANPMFMSVDPAAANAFRLSPGSPAIDAGTANAPIYQDFAGNVRPAGASVDIGAFEVM